MYPFSAPQIALRTVSLLLHYIFFVVTNSFTSYIQRLKANLAFVVSIASPRQMQVLTPPLSCPESLPQLEPLYKELRQYFQIAQTSTLSYPPSNGDSSSYANGTDLHGNTGTMQQEEKANPSLTRSDSVSSGSYITMQGANSLKAQQDLLNSFTGAPSNNSHNIPDPNLSQTFSATSMGPPNNNYSKFRTDNYLARSSNRSGTPNIQNEQSRFFDSQQAQVQARALMQRYQQGMEFNK